MRALVAAVTFVSCLAAFTGCGDMFDDRCTRRPSAEGCLMQPAETLEDLQRP